MFKYLQGQKTAQSDFRIDLIGIVEDKYNLTAIVNVQLLVITF